MRFDHHWLQHVLIHQLVLHLQLVVHVRHLQHLIKSHKLTNIPPPQRKKNNNMNNQRTTYQNGTLIRYRSITDINQKTMICWNHPNSSNIFNIQHIFICCAWCNTMKINNKSNTRKTNFSTHSHTFFIGPSIPVDEYNHLI